MVVGNLLLEVISSREELILQYRVVVVVPMLGAIVTLNTTSEINTLSPRRVTHLMLVGVVFNSIVHLECKGASTKSVSHADNVDTSHPIALKGNHNS